MQAELVLKVENTLLGEGPIWDYRSQQLWWIDIPNGRLHCFEPKSGKNNFFTIGQMLGAAILYEKGGFILAMQHELHFSILKQKH